MLTITSPFGATMTLVFLNHHTIQQRENCNRTEYLSTLESSQVSVYRKQRYQNVSKEPQFLWKEN